MTFFNPLINKIYPTMIFCKIVDDETTEVKHRIEHVQFYEVKEDTVIVHTFPKNEWDGKELNKTIEDYDYINIEK